MLELEANGQVWFDRGRDDRAVGYHIFHARRSMTSHGKKDAKNEQGGTADEGYTRRQNASE